ncbi:hypothetical protein GCM10027514_20960 [Azotobacter armeniacus]
MTMERHREDVLAALTQVLQPRSVLWSARDTEGLTCRILPS